jgi:hypothetical protein
MLQSMGFFMKYLGLIIFIKRRIDLLEMMKLKVRMKASVEH